MKRVVCLLLWVVCHPVFACHLEVPFDLYPPQSYIDKNEQWQGMNVELAKALLDEAGCQYRFFALPWGRAIEKLEKGEVDMMLSVSMLPARKKHFYFIGPQRYENIVLISLASDPITDRKLSDLSQLGKPIAVQPGAYYGEKFAKMQASDDPNNKHFISIPNNEIKLALLRKGRISGFIEEKLNVFYQIKHNPAFKDIVVYPLVLHTNPVYIALSRASMNPQQQTKIHQAYTRLLERKVLAKILGKYE